MELKGWHYLRSKAGLLWRRLRNSETTVGIGLAIFVGLLSGLGAVAFVRLIKAFQWVFFKRMWSIFHLFGHYYVIILPLIGGLIVGPLIYFLAREAQGDSPPKVMESIAVKGGRIRPHVGLVTTLASSVCIGSGGSVGREGPIIQIGASLGSTVGQWVRLPEDWMRTMLLCGAAGGISAIFNAPIGGIFFALEVIQRRFTAANLGFAW
jgi:CIC family chloride channel protein